MKEFYFQGNLVSMPDLDAYNLNIIQEEEAKTIKEAMDFLDKFPIIHDKDNSFERFLSRTFDKKYYDLCLFLHNENNTKINIKRDIKDKVNDVVTESFIKVIVSLLEDPSLERKHIVNRLYNYCVMLRDNNNICSISTKNNKSYYVINEEVLSHYIDLAFTEIYMYLDYKIDYYAKVDNIINVYKKLSNNFKFKESDNEKTLIENISKANKEVYEFFNKIHVYLSKKEITQSDYINNKSNLFLYSFWSEVINIEDLKKQYSLFLTRINLNLGMMASKDKETQENVRKYDAICRIKDIITLSVMLNELLVEKFNFKSMLGNGLSINLEETHTYNLITEDLECFINSNSVIGRRLVEFLRSMNNTTGIVEKTYYSDLSDLQKIKFKNIFNSGAEYVEIRLLS